MESSRFEYSDQEELARTVGDSIRTEARAGIKERDVVFPDSGILIADATLPDNPIIYCNDAFRRIAGYEYDEIIGQGARFLQGEDVDQPGLVELERAMDEGREHTVILRSYRKDGSQFMNQQTVTPIHHSDGKITYFVGIHREVSERQGTEDSLAESEEKFRALAETTTAGIVIYQETKFAYVNPAAEKVFGYSGEELRSMKFWDMVPPEDRERIRETGLARQRGDDVPPRHEARTVSKDGTLRWLDIAATTIEYGGQVAVLVTFFDITERKQIEQDLLDTVDRNTRLGLEMAVFSDITSTMSSSLVIDDVYEKFAQLAKRLIDFDGIAISLIDHDRGTATLEFAIGITGPGRVQQTPVPLQGTLAEKVVGSCSPAILGSDDRELTFPTTMMDEVGLQTVICAPLSPRPDAIGVLYISSVKKDAYSDVDVEIAQRIAFRIGDAVSNAVLFEKAQKAEQQARASEERHKQLAEESALVAEIGRIVSSSLDIEEVYQRIASEVNNLVPYDRLAIAMIDGESQTYTPTFWSGASVPEWERPVALSHVGTIAGQIVSNPVGVLLDRDGIDAWPSLKPGTDIGLMSMIMAPLVSKNHVVGILTFASATRDAYSHRQLALCEQIGVHVSEAIVNARVFGELADSERSVREAEALQRSIAAQNAAVGEIGRIANSTLDIESVYAGVAAHVLDIIPFDIMMVGLVDERRREVTVAHVSGMKLNSPGSSTPYDGHMSGEVVRTRAVLRAGPEQIDKYEGLRSVSNVGLHSFMAVPLISQGDVIAVLWFGSRRTDAYLDANVEIARRVGDHIAGAIANSTTFTELNKVERAVRKSEERQRMLAQENASLGEIGRIVNSSLDMESVYSQFADEVEKLISFDFLTLGLVDEQRGELLTAHVTGVDPALSVRGDVGHYEGLMSGQVIRTRSALRIGPDQYDRYEGLAAAIEAGFESFMTVPLISKEQVVAVMRFGSKRPDAFSDAEVDLALKVGDHITGAIANSQMYAELQQVEKAVRESEERQTKLAQANASLGEIGRIINSSYDITNIDPTFIK